MDDKNRLKEIDRGLWEIERRAACRLFYTREDKELKASLEAEEEEILGRLYNDTVE